MKKIYKVTLFGKINVITCYGLLKKIDYKIIFDSNLNFLMCVVPEGETHISLYLKNEQILSKMKQIKVGP